MFRRPGIGRLHDKMLGSGEVIHDDVLRLLAAEVQTCYSSSRLLSDPDSKRSQVRLTSEYHGAGL